MVKFFFNTIMLGDSMKGKALVVGIIVIVGVVGLGGVSGADPVKQSHGVDIEINKTPVIIKQSHGVDIEINKAGINKTLKINKTLRKMSRNERVVNIMNRNIERIEQVLRKAEQVKLPEQYRTEYISHIEIAREHLENAKNLLNNTSNETLTISTIRNAREEIREAMLEIREATRAIKRVLTKLGEEKGVIVLQDQKLNATGNGLVAFSGNFSVWGEIGAGNVRLFDTEGDMNVYISNASTAVNKNGSLLYSGVSGQIEVSGSSFTMAISGNNISIQIEGTGSLIMRGNGTYTVDDESGSWYRGLKE